MTDRYLIEMTLECGHKWSNTSNRVYYAFAPWVCQKCHGPEMLKKVTITLLTKNIKEIKLLQSIKHRDLRTTK